MKCTKIEVIEKVTIKSTPRRIIAFYYPLTEDKDINGSVKVLDEKFTAEKSFLYKAVKSYVKYYTEPQYYRSKGTNGNYYILSFKVFFSPYADLSNFKEKALKHFQSIIDKM